MNAEFVLVVLFVAAAAAWDTEYDEPFTFECSTNQILTRIQSIYSDPKGDRVFDFTCSPAPYSRALTDCSWSGYLNDFDGLLNYHCKGDKVMTGLASYHQNHQEDRQYDMKCCAVTGVIFHACRYTDWVNDYELPLDYVVPEFMSMKGMTSIHSNSKEDRLFKFNECKHMNTQ